MTNKVKFLPNLVMLSAWQRRPTEGTDHPDNNYDAGWASGGTVKAELQYCNGDGHQSTIACAYYAIHDISPKGNGTYWKDFIGKKQYK